MDTEHLDQLAEQLKADKSPACRRAINRILADLKKRCEKGEYNTPMDAESALRKLIEDERSCQKARASSQ
jgi:predicted transcriptional regulator